VVWSNAYPTTRDDHRVHAYLAVMDLREAIAALPHPYSVALDLDDAGQPAAAVAAALGIEVDAVPMVLRLGREKLARLLLDASDDA